MRRVGHGQRDILHAVALGRGPPTDLAVAAKPARDDEADVPLLENILEARSRTPVSGPAYAMREKPNALS